MLLCRVLVLPNHSIDMVVRDQDPGTGLLPGFRFLFTHILRPSLERVPCCLDKTDIAGSIQVLTIQLSTTEFYLISCFILALPSPYTKNMGPQTSQELEEAIHLLCAVLLSDVMHTAVSVQPDSAASSDKILVRSLVFYLTPFLHYDHLHRMATLKPAGLILLYVWLMPPE
jgi:hypothetical protein